MPGAHREQDGRYCQSKTTVQGQSTVFVNSKLWAVEGDQESHGQGELEAIYGQRNVYINNKLVICAPGDKAGADTENHPVAPTDPVEASSDVFVYDGGGGSATGV